MSKKTPEQSKADEPFMLNVKQSAQKEPDKHKYWFSGVMGKNTISSIFRSAFEELGKKSKTFFLTIVT